MSLQVYVIGESGILEELDLKGIQHLGGPEDADKVVALKKGEYMEHDEDVSGLRAVGITIIRTSLFHDVMQQRALHAGLSCLVVLLPCLSRQSQPHPSAATHVLTSTQVLRCNVCGGNELCPSTSVVLRVQYHLSHNC
jgi:hypothetical protein